MKVLDLKVTVDEANLILEGLGNLPFARVFALVEKIQQQAQAQWQAPSVTEPSGDNPLAVQIEEPADGP